MVTDSRAARGEVPGSLAVFGAARTFVEIDGRIPVLLSFRPKEGRGLHARLF